MKTPVYDVVIIGGGISGTALLYELAQFTDLKHLCLIEKYKGVALVNSHGRNNSQTLHCGDIETNYTLEKAIQVQASAEMIVNYAQKVGQQDHILSRYSKMVLGVGEQECQTLRERYAVFKDHFPRMQMFEASDISRIEPHVMRGRKEEVLGLGAEHDYTAVNFQTLAESFLTQSRKTEDTEIDVKMATMVRSIERGQETFRVETNRGTIEAKFVVVSAGGHSLLFAQRMGFGLNYSCLPVAGSFYYTPKLLNGKVYTMQNDKLPFAAIHGDPDVLVEGKTRFGPTALVLPLLERYNYRSLPDFLRVLHLDKAVMAVMWDLFSEKEIRNYMIKNFFFEVPLVRNRLFLKDARKIIPDMQLKDLSFASRVGGIRPVMIDKVNRKLHLGEAKISPDNGIIFNMTPSPGATSCLANARKDVEIISAYLGCRFDADRLQQTLNQ